MVKTECRNGKSAARSSEDFRFRHFYFLLCPPRWLAGSDPSESPRASCESGPGAPKAMTWPTSPTPSPVSSIRDRDGGPEGEQPNVNPVNLHVNLRIVQKDQ